MQSFWNSIRTGTAGAIASRVHRQAAGPYPQSRLGHSRRRRDMRRWC